MLVLIKPQEEEREDGTVYRSSRSSSSLALYSKQHSYQ